MTHEDQIHEIKHDINSIKQQFVNSEVLQREHVDRLEKKIDTLVLLLEGHPADKERGMIARMIVIEKFIEGMKDTKTYLMGNIAAAVFIITALGGIIGLAIKLYQWIKGL